MEACDASPAGPDSGLAGAAVASVSHCWASVASRALAPRQDSVDLHIEREAQQRSDDHDHSQGPHVPERRLHGDSADELSGDKNLELISSPRPKISRLRLYVMLAASPRA